MFKHVSIIATIFVLFFTGICFGRDDYKLSDDFYKCLEEANGVSTYMAECFYNETELNDKKLNEAYKQLMSEYSDDLKIILRDVQRAWITYRDLKCGFFMDVDSGTLGKMNTQSCFMAETARRAHELERLIGY